MDICIYAFVHVCMYEVCRCVSVRKRTSTNVYMCDAQTLMDTCTHMHIYTHCHMYKYVRVVNVCLMHA